MNSNLSPEQFTAQFSPGAWDADDWAGVGSNLDLEDREHMASLEHSVSKEGVRDPVRVTPEDPRSKHRYVVDGHHRVVAAMRTGKPIPYRDFGQA